jgi:hypothetical protein
MNIKNSKIIHGALIPVVLFLSACNSGSSGGLTAVSKVWGAAATIETSTGDAYAPQIAFDANGNALAVWEQFDGTSFQRIYANRYTASSGVWGTAIAIENDTGDAKRPQIAIDANGNALAVWYQFNGTYRTIRACRYTSSGWGAAVPIETVNVGDALDPQIAIDPQGNALVVWSQDGDATAATRNDIWANRYNVAAGTWGIAGFIETNDLGGASSPQIAMDPNGNALAVWYQYDGSSVNDIWANHYLLGAGWAGTTLIEAGTGSAEVPQIAVDAIGNGLAVWQQWDGTQYSIWANRFAVGTGSWGTAELVETDNFGPASHPQVAFDNYGNAVAVWQQNTVTGINIWANRYTSSQIIGWDTPAIVETGNTGVADYPQVAFDASGNALAVWQKNDGARNNIWANRYAAASGTWGIAGLIETDNSGSAETPQIAIDANGNALAVWDQFDGSHYNIWANRYH